MEKSRYISAIIASLLCVSCMKPFDLKLEDKPAIFLEAFPGAEDVVVFTILPAYSNSNTPERPSFEPHIKFTVNGEEVPVTQNIGYRVVENYDELSYIAEYKPVPGDKMRVEVAAEGFDPVYAETYIPECFPERKVGYDKISSGRRDYNVVSVSIEDDADTDYAYGVQILHETLLIYEDGTTESATNYYAGVQISDDYDFAPETLEGVRLSFNGWHMHTGWADLAAWDDDSSNGNEMTMSFIVSGAFEDFFESENEIVKWGEGVRCIERRHNKLVLYSMSEEFHKFAVAQNTMGENAGMFAGLAPSNFCYSNVVGGYGAFAGVSRVETDWITPEFIENN